MNSSTSPLPDSIKVRFATEHFLGNEKTTDQTLFPDASGVFYFTTQAKYRIGIIGFYIYDQKISKLINDVGEFFFLPGDAISITLFREDNLYKGLFSGKGSSKYICRSQLEEQRNRFYENHWSYLDSAAEKKQFTDQLIIESSRFIDSCKGQLENSVYQLLHLENFSYYYTQWMANVKYNYERHPGENTWQKILNAYHAFTFSDTLFNKEIASASNYYLLHQLSKMQFKLLVESGNKGYPYRRLYDSIKMNYDGLLRDHLLLVCLDNYRSFQHIIDFQPDEFMACVEDARTFIQDPYLKECLLVLSLFKRGTPVCNFVLTDPHDKKISLTDFSGKVVLLDIWGTGCSGCASFYRRMKDGVYPRFKSRSEFEVVSIGIDKKAEDWMKGIKSGRYTSDQHINLFTEGKGIDHPFTRYYHLRSVPFILLIDKKGKIYSKIELGIKEEKIIQLIEEALAAS